MATLTATVTDSITGELAKLTASFSVSSANPIVGVNSSGISDVQAACGIQRSWRGYNTPDITSTGIPTAWPGGQAGTWPSTVIMPVVSIKPSLTAYSNGSLDAALLAFAKTIPAGVMISCWHEGERANENNSAATITGLHEWAYPIIKQGSPNCLYGQIYTTYSTRSSRVTNWTCPGLDFYGLDGYSVGSTDTADVNLGTCATQILAAEPNARFAVTETNSDIQSQRPSWFTTAWSWAQQNECIVFQSFWNAVAPDTTLNWIPSDTATINVLKSITSQSG